MSAKDWRFVMSLDRSFDDDGWGSRYVRLTTTETGVKAMTFKLLSTSYNQERDAEKKQRSVSTAIDAPK